MRVLIADDDPAIRTLLRLALSTIDAEVTEAENGAEALREARQAPPDVAILDVMMPVLDGIGLLRRLRARGDTAGVRVCMLTAKTDGLTRRLAEKAGSDAFVTKPFDTGELISLIEVLAESPPRQPVAWS